MKKKQVWLSLKPQASSRRERRAVDDMCNLAPQFSAARSERGARGATQAGRYTAWHTAMGTGYAYVWMPGLLKRILLRLIGEAHWRSPLECLTRVAHWRDRTVPGIKRNVSERDLPHFKTTKCRFSFWVAERAGDVGAFLRALSQENRLSLKRTYDRVHTFRVPTRRAGNVLPLFLSPAA